MNYQSLSAWIFVFLLLLIFFMALFPTSTVIGLGVVLTPILVLIQAYVILKAQAPADPPSAEDRWYER